MDALCTNDPLHLVPKSNFFFWSNKFVHTKFLKVQLATKSKIKYAVIKYIYPGS